MAIGEGSVIAAAVAPLALPAPMTSEKYHLASGIQKLSA
jgi:hypothetical protein